MIYLDNAATSYPKPKNVLLSVMPSVNNYSFNSGRGGYTQSLASAEKYIRSEKEWGSFSAFLLKMLFLPRIAPKHLIWR